MQRTVTRAAVRSGAWAADTLAVSHRWETPDEPDPTGAQLAALRAHPEIAWVWVDVCAMPQGGARRTRAEEVEFRALLPNVNLLYLACSVLIVMDASYASRFWTLYESWLAMQRVTPEGLAPGGDRAAIACVHNADVAYDAARLRAVWATRTPAEAHAVLARPDVLVTNAGDKDAQLARLRGVEDALRA